MPGINTDEAMRVLDDRALFDWYQITRDGQSRLRINVRLVGSGEYRDCWGRKGEDIPHLVERLLCEKIAQNSDDGEAIMMASILR
jgi:hypothetical protein